MKANELGYIEKIEIKNAITEAMDLIGYLHELTVIPANMTEDYANRYANTMELLLETKRKITNLLP